MRRSDGLIKPLLTAVQQYADHQSGQCGKTHGVIGFVMYCFVGLFGTAFDLLARLFFKFAEFLFRTG